MIFISMYHINSFNMILGWCSSLVVHFLMAHIFVLARSSTSIFIFLHSFNSASAFTFNPPVHILWPAKSGYSPTSMLPNEPAEFSLLRLCESEKSTISFSLSTSSICFVAGCRVDSKGCNVTDRSEGKAVYYNFRTRQRTRGSHYFA